jgi:hypothetical protein
LLGLKGPCVPVDVDWLRKSRRWLARSELGGGVKWCDPVAQAAGRSTKKFGGCFGVLAVFG